MTSKFTPSGEWVGVTALSVLPMKVTGQRTAEKNGYTAIRFKIQDLKSKKEIEKEVRTDENMEVGSEVKWEEIFKAGDAVDVTGISKGKGFAGVVKRYHFKGGPRTHGQSDRERAPGSSGSTTTPGRVYRGKRRAGHMGTDTVTIGRMKILAVEPEKKLIIVIGSVPGARNFQLLTVRKHV